MSASVAPASANETLDPAPRRYIPAWCVYITAFMASTTVVAGCFAVLLAYNTILVKVAPVQTNFKHPVCPYSFYNPTHPCGGSLESGECFDALCGGTRHEARMSGFNWKRVFTQSGEREFSRPYFEATDRNVSTYQDLPGACKSIFNLDVGSRKEVHECVKWCKTQIHSSLLPLSPCHSSGGHSGNIVLTVCGKANMARTFHLIPEWALSYVPALAGVLYSWPGLVVALLIIALCPTDRLNENEDGDFEGPSATELRAFSSRHWPPLCFLACPHDAAGHLMQLYVALGLMLVESALDAASLASYTLLGEPIYALFTLVTMTTIADPMQTQGLVHLLYSIRTSFVSAELLAHRAVEGLRDAGVGACLAYYSFILCPSQHMSWSTAMLRVCMMGISFAVTIPAASESQHLLVLSSEHKLNIRKYYDVVAAKRAFGLQRYEQSCFLLASTFLAVVMKFATVSLSMPVFCVMVSTITQSTNCKVFNKLSQNGYNRTLILIATSQAPLSFISAECRNACWQRAGSIVHAALQFNMVAVLQALSLLVGALSLAVELAICCYERSAIDSSEPTNQPGDAGASSQGYSPSLVRYAVLSTEDDAESQS